VEAGDSVDEFLDQFPTVKREQPQGVVENQMSKRTLKSELIDQVNGLPLEKQRQMLEFARSLSCPKGKPAGDLFLFGGTIEAEDLSAMKEAIEDGCEQINADDW
jgi:hypothetical protein